MSKIDIDNFIEHLVKLGALDCNAVQSALYAQGLIFCNYKIQKIRENSSTQVEVEKNQESKDEKIRKTIIRFFVDNYPNETKMYDGTVTVGDAIAWLEKQDKKKLPIERLPSEMKTVSESLGFTTQEECDDYNKIVTDLIMSDDNKSEKKSADKTEPKFKVGDWITDGQLTCKVLGITGKSYELHLHNDDYCHFETDVQSVDKYYHLWTIEDAKDGDMLCVKYGNDEMPFIFTGKQGDVAYCALNSFGEFVLSIAEWLLKTSVLPVTKEQRDLLFQKMKESGYEWNTEKKELKKIHVIDEGKNEMDYCFTKMMNGEKVSSAWCERDEYRLGILTALCEDKLFESVPNSTMYEEMKMTIDWLKLLRDKIQHQSQWRPSDEQMQCILSEVEGWTKGCPKQKILESLYNDLKKLKEQ